MQQQLSGVSILLVSHDLGLVTETADRVMWMERGTARMIGEPAVVVEAYRRSAV